MGDSLNSEVTLMRQPQRNTLEVKVRTWVGLFLYYCEGQSEKMSLPKLNMEVKMKLPVLQQKVLLEMDIKYCIFFLLVNIFKGIRLCVCHCVCVCCVSVVWVWRVIFFKMLWGYYKTFAHNVTIWWMEWRNGIFLY